MKDKNTFKALWSYEKDNKELLELLQKEYGSPAIFLEKLLPVLKERTGELKEILK